MEVCIVGGGTAGWMAASAMAKKFENQSLNITLVESEDIGTVGVGEATLPHIRFFNQALGVNEREFMKETRATFKLGIEFVDWGKIGQSYIHPFGDFGQSINNIEFYQAWLSQSRSRSNSDLSVLSDYAFGTVAATQGKFQFPHSGQTRAQRSFGYAYQFDSGLYAKFLRRFAENLGVTRIEGKVVDTTVEPNFGNVTSLTLLNNQVIKADLFIDCSGFRGLLIGQALKTGYQDWSSWLPCNRAVAVPCERQNSIPPYTRATAQKAGWIWRIPLQHRTGNGHVYWSEFTSDQDALDTLISQLDGKPSAEPKQLYFKTGRRNAFWKNNVIAIGLSAGFLEPLESTSIHLIQEGITDLLALFPHENYAHTGGARVLQINSLDCDEYNQRMALQFERIRDFLLLHYVANDRSDSEMWRYFSSMSLPDSLVEKLDLWKKRAYVQRYEHGTFLPPSWVAVLLGQNISPENCDPRVASISSSEFHRHAEAIKKDIKNAVDAALPHEAFLRKFGAYYSEPVLR